KFHCELNFIEFFWGAVKQWLQKNCDYTFATLQENPPTALAKIMCDFPDVWKWEHCMIRWMDGYRSGLSTMDAQFQVKHFSSKAYNLHRCMRETLARMFDQ
ncbi:hypothetical protein L208DRAFT_1287162, partial [Tricholoma matsutake]